MKSMRKPVNLLIGLVLLLTVLVIGSESVSASGTIVPFVPADGSPAAGSGEGQFSYPKGLATDSSGNVYVADFNNTRIQVISSDGTFIKQWGGSGSGDGQFNRPSSVAVDRAGNVYVADYGNNRVQKFTSDGVFLMKWGSGGSGNGQFATPSGIAIDSNDNVYVADDTLDRIQKFTSDGVFLAKWGVTGSGIGQFICPTEVTVDNSGNVYVADSDNHRIQKFTSDGVFLAKWGSFGTGDGQFNYAARVAVDSNNCVYVTDFSNHRIQKFTSHGAFLAKWGSVGVGAGQFRNPTGIVVDSSGNVYVSDASNNRIQVLRAPTLKATSMIKGQTITSLGKPGLSPDSLTAGSVTITAEQAADSAGLAPFVTLFEGTEADMTVQAVKYASGSNTDSFATDPVYAGSAINNNDFFIIKLTAADGTTVSYYKIAVTVNAPAKPVIKSAVAGDRRVNLSWDPVAGAASYNVYMSATSGSYGSVLATVSADVYSYEAAGLVNGTTYYLVVTAANSGGESPYANEVSATPQPPTPAAPVLQLEATGSEYIKLKWDPVAGATGYKIYMSTTSGSYGAALATVGAAVYNYDATGLVNGTLYYLVVTAINGGGESSLSNEISSTPQPPAPAAPVLQLEATGSGYIKLKWDPVAGATGYKIYMSTTSGSYGAALATVGAAVYNYDAIGLLNRTLYYFVVTAANDSGDSSLSNEISAAPHKSSSGKSSHQTTPTDSSTVTPSVPEAPSAPAATLSDITGHWAENNINWLVEAGIVSGYPDGTFRPDGTITRAEFVTMLVKAFKLEAKPGTVFDDTVSHWAKDSISAVIAYGILGYSDNQFGPDDPVTREQMAVMLDKVLQLSTADEQSAFSDDDNISGWAAQALAAVVSEEIMNGYPDNTFRPQGNASRAEAITVIFNVMKR